MDFFKLRRGKLRRSIEEAEGQKNFRVQKKYLRIFLKGMCLAGAISIFLHIFYDKYVSEKEIGIHYSIFRSLPLRTYSRAQGYLGMVSFPWPVNIPVVGFMKILMRISLSDAERENIRDYRSVNDLFTRKLKPSSRPIGPGIVSPVDGTIIYAGLAENGEKCKIKGVHYKVEELLLDRNVLADVKDGHSIFQIIIYLAPHNYHRFHSFVDFTLTRILHVPSLLFSVGNLSMKYFPGLLSNNERVIFQGEYEHGQCYTVAVGSLGVGSISSSIAKFKTNRRTYLHSDPIEFSVDPHRYAKGEELGHFNLGSTIVLIFSAPKNLTICKKEGEIRMGETLGTWEPIRKLINPDR